MFVTGAVYIEADRRANCGGTERRKRPKPVYFERGGRHRRGSNDCGVDLGGYFSGVARNCRGIGRPWRADFERGVAAHGAQRAVARCEPYFERGGARAFATLRLFKERPT
jgi:hypothetical protein